MNNFNFPSSSRPSSQEPQNPLPPSNESEASTQSSFSPPDDIEGVDALKRKADELIAKISQNFSAAFSQEVSQLENSYNDRIAHVVVNPQNAKMIGEILLSEFNEMDRCNKEFEKKQEEYDKCKSQFSVLFQEIVSKIEKSPQNPKEIYSCLQQLDSCYKLVHSLSTTIPSYSEEHEKLRAKVDNAQKRLEAIQSALPNKQTSSSASSAPLVVAGQSASSDYKDFYLPLKNIIDNKLNLLNGIVNNVNDNKIKGEFQKIVKECKACIDFFENKCKAIPEAMEIKDKFRQRLNVVQAEFISVLSSSETLDSAEASSSDLLQRFNKAIGALDPSKDPLEKYEIIYRNLSSYLSSTIARDEDQSLISQLLKNLGEDLCRKARSDPEIIAIRNDIEAVSKETPESAQDALRPLEQRWEAFKNKHQVLGLLLHTSYKPTFTDPTIDFIKICLKNKELEIQTSQNWKHDIMQFTGPDAQSKVREVLRNEFEECQRSINRGANPAWAKTVPTPNLPMENITIPLGGGIEVGVAAVQGSKPNHKMEDTYIATTLSLSINGKNIEIPVMGVFDGHGGDNLSKYIRDNLPGILNKGLSQLFADVKPEEQELALHNYLTTIFIEVGYEYQQFIQGQLTRREITKEQYDNCKEAGTIANIVLMVKGNLWTANLGDSRAFLSVDSAFGNEKNKAIGLSDDAIFEGRFLEHFKKRGGELITDDEDRAKRDFLSGLNMASSLEGDPTKTTICQRANVTCVPLKILPGSRGKLVISTDGGLFRGSSNDIGKFIQEKLHGMKGKEMAQVLAGKAHAVGSSDDITFLVVNLNNI